MIQRVKVSNHTLWVSWQRLNFYQQLVLVLYVLMLFLSSIKFVEREIWGVLGTRLVHFGSYFVLGLLIYKSFRYPFLQRCIFAFVAIALLAGLDELSQVFVSHAQVQLDDWITDVAGGIIAIGLFAIAQIVRDSYRRYRTNDK